MRFAAVTANLERSYTVVMTATVGILHPGAMGSSVGAATKARAGADGLEDVGTLAELVEQSDIIVSICPPSAAEDVARQVIALEFRGLYVDANAVSPATARAIANLIENNGASFVDGGIVGPPARATGSTCLYLSGEQAEPVADLFAASPLNAIALGRQVKPLR